MNKDELDIKVTQIAKSILSYCITRTSNQFDAEDLAQDIIVEIYKSAPNLKDDNAFYGFMWAVAGNVYKQWCKAKAKASFCELDESVNLAETDEFDIDDDSSDISLLRRELTLLSEKYRKAVILYYIKNKSCREISEFLSVSESMVKYLLFKSRQILKEGMNMERNYGQQSYNPKELKLLFWGCGTNRYAHLCENKISQNILFACYNDKLTEEQISLEIGVALPYMEDKLRELCEYGLIKTDGKKYHTNIIIFTNDFANEISVKTSAFRKSAADLLVKAVEESENKIRAIGFRGSDMNKISLAWHIVSHSLFRAVIEEVESRVKLSFPEDKFGFNCYVWGVEEPEHKSALSPFLFGITRTLNDRGDKIEFMDFPINGEIMHEYCFSRQNVTNIILDIAKGNTDNFNQNDMTVIAEIIKKGYVISDANGLRVNLPVFTKEQFESFNKILEPTVQKLADDSIILIDTIAKILKNHIPVHLKGIANDMAYFRLFEDAVAATVAELTERRFLLPCSADTIHPTNYIVLN